MDRTHSQTMPALPLQHIAEQAPDGTLEHVSRTATTALHQDARVAEEPFQAQCMVEHASCEQAAELHEHLSACLSESQPTEATQQLSGAWDASENPTSDMLHGLSQEASRPVDAASSQQEPFQNLTGPAGHAEPAAGTFHFLSVPDPLDFDLPLLELPEEVQDQEQLHFDAHFESDAQQSGPATLQQQTHSVSKADETQTDNDPRSLPQHSMSALLMSEVRHSQIKIHHLSGRMFSTSECSCIAANV